MDKLRSKGSMGAERLAAYYADPEKSAERRREALKRLQSPESRQKMKAVLRGCHVPSELEEEWQGLKRKGFTNREVASTLGLRYALRRKTLDGRAARQIET
jgi:hypothetical protein